VIFHLNPKARFSNGQPLTAEDVKFSFDTYQTKANPGLQMYLQIWQKPKCCLNIRSNLVLNPK
jgi:ABC-type transport system substrate-binding protein